MQRWGAGFTRRFVNSLLRDLGCFFFRNARLQHEDLLSRHYRHSVEFHYYFINENSIHNFQIYWWFIQNLSVLEAECLTCRTCSSLRKQTPFLPLGLRPPDERKRASAIWADLFRAYDRQLIYDNYESFPAFFARVQLWRSAILANFIWVRRLLWNDVWGNVQLNM